MPYTNENYNNIKNLVLQQSMMNTDYIQTFIEDVYSILVASKTIQNPKIDLESRDLKSVPESLHNALINLSLCELKDIVKEVLYQSAFRRYEACEHTTTQLNELTYHLLELDKSGNNEVLDLCSESGTFIARVLDSDASDHVQKVIYANEINNKLAYIAKLVSDIFGNGSTKVDIAVGDIFKDNLDVKFDKARIFTPLGVRVFMDEETSSSMFEDVPFRTIANSEWAFIDKALSNKKENFRAVAMVLGKNLRENHTSLYRKRIIENGYLEGIIELPTKVSPCTGVQLYLLVFSNDNKEVKFLDASLLTIKNKNRFSEREKVVTLDIGSILDSYFDCKNTKTIDETVELKNLTPSLVNAKKREIKNGVSLSEVAEVFTGNQYTLKNFAGMISEDETGYSILRSNDIDDYIINLNKIIHINYKETKFDKYCIQYGDVIVTSKSSKVKVGVVDFEPKEKIIVTGGMIIARPDVTKLNPTYLKVFLDSKLGQQSIKAIQKGTSIITLNSRDLSEIKIPFVDMEKQEIIANQYQRKVASLLALRNEASEIEKQIFSLLNETVGE